MVTVYRHIDTSTNKIFYIGIGTEKRAYDYVNRSKEWKRQASNVSIKTEILFECKTREEAYRKEIEFITLYGRQDKGTGTLVNKTDGGGWLKGTIWSVERIKKYSDNAKKSQTLKKWQEKHGPAVKGKKLPKQKQEHIDIRVEGIKKAWQSKSEEERKRQTALFINNNPSYRVQKCIHCGREIQGASAFKRFHGENCKNKTNN